MKKIYRPCDQCVHNGKCEYDRGCYQWKSWFKAYWSELRKKFCIENKERGD